MSSSSSGATPSGSSSSALGGMSPGMPQQAAAVSSSSATMAASKAKRKGDAAAAALKRPRMTSASSSEVGGAGSIGSSTQTLRYEQQQQQQQQKRTRVGRACDSCFAKKDRCDGAQPVCKVCRDMDRRCTYNRPERKRGPLSGVRQRLEAQIEVLESLLGYLTDSFPGLSRDALQMLSLDDGEAFARQSASRSSPPAAGEVRLPPGDIFPRYGKQEARDLWRQSDLAVSVAPSLGLKLGGADEDEEVMDAAMHRQRVDEARRARARLLHGGFPPVPWQQPIPPNNSGGGMSHQYPIDARSIGMIPPQSAMPVPHGHNHINNFAYDHFAPQPGPSHSGPAPGYAPPAPVYASPPPPQHFSMGGPAAPGRAQISSRQQAKMSSAPSSSDVHSRHIKHHEQQQQQKQQQQQHQAPPHLAVLSDLNASLRAVKRLIQDNSKGWQLPTSTTASSPASPASGTPRTLDEGHNVQPMVPRKDGPPMNSQAAAGELHNRQTQVSANTAATAPTAAADDDDLFVAQWDGGDTFDLNSLGEGADALAYALGLPSANHGPADIHASSVYAPSPAPATGFMTSLLTDPLSTAKGPDHSQSQAPSNAWPTSASHYSMSRPRMATTSNASPPGGAEFHAAMTPASTSGGRRDAEGAKFVYGGGEEMDLMANLTGGAQQYPEGQTSSILYQLGLQDFSDDVAAAAAAAAVASGGLVGGGGPGGNLVSSSSGEAAMAAMGGKGQVASGGSGAANASQSGAFGASSHQLRPQVLQQHQQTWMPRMQI